MYGVSTDDAFDEWLGFFSDALLQRWMSIDTIEDSLIRYRSVRTV